MTNRLIAAAFALSAIAGTALAQNTDGTATTTEAPADAMAASSGLMTADMATVAVKFVTVKPADVMASKLIGLNVYNNQNEELGEVTDVVIENGKAISGVVVSVGGFLGLGESYVVLDPSTVVLNQRDGNWRAFVDTNKDNLKNAPKFSYAKTNG